MSLKKLVTAFSVVALSTSGQKARGRGGDQFGAQVVEVFLLVRDEILAHAGQFAGGFDDFLLVLEKQITGGEEDQRIPQRARTGAQRALPAA